MYNDDWIFALELALENKLTLPTSLRNYLEDEYISHCVEVDINDDPRQTLISIYRHGVKGATELEDLELVEYFTAWEYSPVGLESILRQSYSNIEIVKMTEQYLNKDHLVLNTVEHYQSFLD